MKCNYNCCSSKCKGDIDVESCNVLRAYQKGRADGYSQAENDYHTQTEKDRQSSYDCGYQQGKADGAREFAKWICDGVTPKRNPFVNWMALETLRDGSHYGIEVEELLEEYEKEQNNG